MDYNPQKIEPKWQKKWEKQKLYQAEDFSKKPKKYLMVEFPYPSGDGLHVGHARSYVSLDTLARKKRMEGFNVLFPMGWDAFGLPTENYAIKTGIHPQKVTEQNIKRFKEQMKSLGLSFDWSRAINTTDPKYYKWTQWIFLKLFEKGLAYKKEMPINWCPSCKIGLANEEVIQGKCERCEAPVERRTIKQWMLKITKYADRLLEDLEKVDYQPRIKAQQINWIGKSVGDEVVFKIKGIGEIRVFTTRLDTIFGVTALVLAPEHESISNLESRISNLEEVRKYIEKARRRSDLERTEQALERTGVELRGVKAVNPANGEEVSIWIADYVIPTYGGGAVMMVPAHDKRDWGFAKKHKLEIREVISGGDVSKEAYVDYGILVNSGEFSGLKSKEAIEKIEKFLGKKDLAKKEVQYKLRDWIFSRQHYWGEPIPIVHCSKCGAVPVPEKDLPVELPHVEKYQPTDTGESPLVNIKEWVNVKCPKCGGPAKRETDTMPNWAGSNWYYLRYIDPGNDKQLASSDKLKYWLPIDLYNGGMEHTTLHLLYSRFWHKFLYDIGVVPTNEPYQRRISHGMVLASDNRKMSKSFGNVVNPDDTIRRFGADTLRLYEMFMGPFEQAISWDSQGVEGCWRFLKKVWKLVSENQKQKNEKTSEKTLRKLHWLIKKADEDLEAMKFNTAVAAFMEFSNVWQEKGQILSQKDIELFLKILSPFVPHITEELWSTFGHKSSIFNEDWPEYDPKLVKEEIFELVIQINGKVRDKVEVAQDISEEEAKKVVLAREKVKKWLKGKEAKKVIFVPNRLINLCVE